MTGCPTTSAWCSWHWARQDPEFPYRQGDYDIAGKCFLRRFSDGLAGRVPTPEEIEQIQHDIPGVAIVTIPSKGDRLSALPWQDSYSYEPANLFIGAANQEELIDKYERCTQTLRFEFDP